jgi:hypothetical protein
MVEKINNLIEKFGLLQSIKMLGGFRKFREIVDNNPQLSEHLDKLKGSCSISNLEKSTDAYFDFYILNVDTRDDFAELTVDMVVDFMYDSGCGCGCDCR